MFKEVGLMNSSDYLFLIVLPFFMLVSPIFYLSLERYKHLKNKRILLILAFEPLLLFLFINNYIYNIVDNFLIIVVGFLPFSLIVSGLNRKFEKTLDMLEKHKDEACMNGLLTGAGISFMPISVFIVLRFISMPLSIIGMLAIFFPFFFAMVMAPVIILLAGVSIEREQRTKFSFHALLIEAEQRKNVLREILEIRSANFRKWMLIGVVPPLTYLIVSLILGY